MDPDINDATIELQGQICRLVADFESQTRMRVETIIPNRGFQSAPFGDRTLWGINVTIGPTHK